MGDLRKEMKLIKAFKNAASALKSVVNDHNLGIYGVCQVADSALML